MRKYGVNGAPEELHFYIGLGLAISSSLFIGASFIIKKKALIKLQKCGNLRAGSGGFGYLKEWIWWAGLLSMGIGELANFVAYAFAPASLVTPLGALSVLVSAALASKCLREKLNLLGKVGCLLCILGSTVLVLHSPKENDVESMEDLWLKLKAPNFILYVVLVVFCSMAITFHFGPAYGKKNVFVYLLLCSSIGSLTVVCCKGLGVALHQTALGVEIQNNWLTWFLLIATIICITTQMNYLNKSIDLFNASIVTPIYYVLFTTLVIIASNMLFHEWKNMGTEDMVGAICGFLVIIVGIFLLNVFKDADVSFSDINSMFQPKAEIVSNIKWGRNSDEFLNGDVECQYNSIGNTVT